MQASPHESDHRRDAPETHGGAASVRVSPMQVRALSEAAELAGVSVETFVARTGLVSARMSDPHSWFTLEEFDRLMVAAVQLTDDPAFGLHWGERSPMMQFDLVPTLIATAPTLRAAIEALLQFQPLMASRTEMRFREDGTRGSLVCDVLGLSELGIRTRTELSISGIARLLHYLGVRDAVRRIDVAYERPAHGGEYDRLFGPIVHFAQPSTRVLFVRAALDRPHPHRNAELHQVIRERTEQMRKHALGELTHAEQLESLIVAALPKLLSAEEAARALDISERSLRRRLASENVSYTELLDRVRQRLAEELLARGTRSVKEIAHSLGFRSASGFHGAYRRWKGNSPARERAQRARG